MFKFDWRISKVNSISLQTLLSPLKYNDLLLTLYQIITKILISLQKILK